MSILSILLSLELGCYNSIINLPDELLHRILLWIGSACATARTNVHVQCVLRSRTP
jgi:hypothetical protein